jgi:hypothetical protein
MEKEFVSYDLSVKLKELGFNEPCLAYWDNHKLFIIDRNSERIQKNSNYKDIFEGIISAPLFQQAFRWFREIKEVEYQITYAGAKGRYNAFVEDYFYDNNGDLKEFTYKEAELACLEKLIEIIEQNNKEDETN